MGQADNTARLPKLLSPSPSLMLVLRSRAYLCGRRKMLGSHSPPTSLIRCASSFGSAVVSRSSSLPPELSYLNAPRLIPPPPASLFVPLSDKHACHLLTCPHARCSERMHPSPGRSDVAVGCERARAHPSSGRFVAHRNSRSLNPCTQTDGRRALTLTTATSECMQHPARTSSRPSQDPACSL
eukprot:334356-Pleurochrysis_carterae.AAC.2